ACAWVSVEEKRSAFARRQIAWRDSQPSATRGRMDRSAICFTAQPAAGWLDGRGANRAGFSSHGPFRHCQRYARDCDETVERKIAQTRAGGIGARALRG